jgi:hypothetical protein
MVKNIIIAFAAACCLVFQAGAFQSSSLEPLPGTAPLTWDLSPDKISVKMMEGAHQLIDKEIAASVVSRSRFWNRDFSSGEAYEQSVNPNRRRLMNYIGMTDRDEPPANYNVGFEEQTPPVQMQRISDHEDPEVVAETEKSRLPSPLAGVEQGVC